MQLHYVEREAAEQSPGHAEQSRSPRRRQKREPDLRRARRDDPDVHHADGSAALAHGEGGVAPREACARSPVDEPTKRFSASRRIREVLADPRITEQRNDRLLVFRLDLPQRYAPLPERRQAALP